MSATGWEPDLSIYAMSARPEMHGGVSLPRVTPEFESVNVPGLYFAGALTHSKVVSGGGGRGARRRFMDKGRKGDIGRKNEGHILPRENITASSLFSSFSLSLLFGQPFDLLFLPSFCLSDPL